MSIFRGKLKYEEHSLFGTSRFYIKNTSWFVKYKGENPVYSEQEAIDICEAYNNKT